MIASESGNLQLIRELIRRGADLNYQDSVSLKLFKLVSNCSSRLHSSFDLFFSIHTHKKDGWSALLLAVKEDNTDIVIELLDAVADLETVDCVSRTF